MDFGMAKVIGADLIDDETQSMTATGKRGTPYYMAPQVYEGGGRGKNKRYYDPFAADIWSLGVTLYYLLTNSYPFESGPEKSYKDNVCDRSVDFTPLAEDTHELWKHIMPKMLDKDEAS